MTTWTIDPSHSEIGFSVRHLGFARVRGRFTRFSGELSFESDALRGARTSIETASVDTANADRDTHLRSPDFFEAERWPSLRFESTSVEPKEGGALRLHGALTIRDHTRPVVLDLAPVGRVRDPWGNERVAFSASTTVDRRDFGLTWNQAIETGGFVVGHDVTIELDVQAVRASAESAE